MRIAIAGLHQEASTFSRHRCGEDFFRWDRGEAILKTYQLAGGLTPADTDVEFVPLLVLMGSAGGQVARDVYDRATEEVAAGLRAACPVDGVYLHMHGAMVVEGMDRAEERFVRMIREIAGEEAILGMHMDPHGNLTRELMSLVDLACTHRNSPHTDAHLTPGRTLSQLIAALRSGRRPHVAWVPVPSLLPGERTATVVEPGHTVFGRVLPAIGRHGVEDAGIWVGFAWADEYRNTASAMAQGPDPEAAKACAEELARAYWEAREAFSIVSDHHGSWSEALDFLMTGPARPLFISDSGDNVTAGATGDLTYALAGTLARRDVQASGKKILFTGLFDPESLAEAQAAGVGGTLRRAIGATVDDRFAQPVAAEWLVVELIAGLNPEEGITGALLRAGAVDVIVQSHRQRFVTADDPTITQNGLPHAAIIDTAPYDAVVVKNGYLFPSQEASAGSAFMALTPGGTDLDFGRLEFTARQRPLFPFERDFTPELKAELLCGPDLRLREMSADGAG